MKTETCVVNCIDSRVGHFNVCGPALDTSVMPQMRQGVYEPNIQELFCSLIEPGMVVCDIGANFGQHTVVLSKLVGSTGRVFAIEASPINVEYICQTVEANNLTNVEVIERGVWSHETELTFSHVDNAEATSFCSNKEDIRTIEPNPNCKYRTIRVSALDDLVDDDVDFIKVDIEGSELFAMKGNQNCLRRRSPILMELNVFTSRTFMGVEITDIIRYMASYQYHYLYMYYQGQWNHITEQTLLGFFANGAILIDILFSTQRYPPEQFANPRNVYGWKTEGTK